MKPLPAPVAPTFPTWSELIGGVGTAPKPGPKQELFAALIGDARELFQELLDDPSRFEPEVAELLQQIINGRRRFEDMDKMERGLLNRAAVDFAQMQSPAPKREGPKEAPRAGLPAAAAAASSADEEPELEWSERGRAVAVAPDLPKDAPTFWWKDV